MEFKIRYPYTVYAYDEFLFGNDDVNVEDFAQLKGHAAVSLVVVPLAVYFRVAHHCSFAHVRVEVQ